jgi:hypothetical protein
MSAIGVTNISTVHDKPPAQKPPYTSTLRNDTPKCSIWTTLRNLAI